MLSRGVDLAAKDLGEMKPPERCSRDFRGSQDRNVIRCFLAICRVEYCFSRIAQIIELRRSRIGPATHTEE